MKNFENMTWQEKCVDVMKQAEYDKEVEEGLVWLAQRAINENKSIYQLIKEAVLIKHAEEKHKDDE